MTLASAPPPATGYSAAMRTLHWATAALLIGSYVSTWVISGAMSSAEITRLVMLHRSFSLAILTLTAIRLLWRWRTSVPPPPVDMPALQRAAARANVVGLYSLLVLQPLLGLAGSILHGDNLILLGGVVLPNFLPVDRKMAHVVFEVHGTVALLLLALIGMHAVAALYHHFIRKDDVLAGMLPALKRRGWAVWLPREWRP